MLYLYEVLIGIPYIVSGRAPYNFGGNHREFVPNAWEAYH